MSQLTIYFKQKSYLLWLQLKLNQSGKITFTNIFAGHCLKWVKWFVYDLLTCGETVANKKINLAALEVMKKSSKIQSVLMPIQQSVGSAASPGRLPYTPCGSSLSLGLDKLFTCRFSQSMVGWWLDLCRGASQVEFSFETLISTWSTRPLMWGSPSVWIHLSSFPFFDPSDTLT